MATDVFNPEACDEARRNKTQPEPTKHSGPDQSPRGRGPLDPTFEADPLGARGLRHATPPAPTEKELLNVALNQATNRLQGLQNEMYFLQADIDKLKRRLVELKSSQ